MRCIAVWQLVALWSLLAQCHGETRFEITAADPQRVSRSVGVHPNSKLLDRVRSRALRPPENYWEQLHVQAAQRAIESVLSVKPASLSGISTLTEDGGDVLLSKWATTDTALAMDGIAVWDSPEFIYFVLRCAPEFFATPQTVLTHLRSLLSWKFTGTYLMAIQAWHGKWADGTVLAGGGRVGPGFQTGSQFGWEFTLLAKRRAGAVELVLQFGKVPFRSLYPDESSYVNERFPPLKERVIEWSRAMILAEIGRTLDASGPIQAFQDRDRILIREILKRGLDSQHVEDLLLGVGKTVPMDYMGRRIQSILQALKESKTVAIHSDAMFRAAVLLANRKDLPPHFSSMVFQHLMMENNVDFVRQAMDCALSCVHKEGPFRYLSERGTGKELVQLAAIDVAESLRLLKRVLLEYMRNRIGAQQEVR